MEFHNNNQYGLLVTKLIRMFGFSSRQVSSLAKGEKVPFLFNEKKIDKVFLEVFGNYYRNFELEDINEK